MFIVVRLDVKTNRMAVQSTHENFDNALASIHQAESNIKVRGDQMFIYEKGWWLNTLTNIYQILEVSEQEE